MLRFLFLCFCGRWDFSLLELFTPQGRKGQFLGAVNGYRIAVVDPVGDELFLPNQFVDQVDIGLLDLIDIDFAQQTKEGIGMRKRFQLRKQEAEILLEHRF